jgi:hypothetical protein
MTRVIRSRRAGLSRDQVRQQPLYARMLGLQYVAPGGFLCFMFLEGAVALGILLALAELVSWWGVIVLPATVAVMVKLNDVVAGAVSRPAARSSAGAPAAGRRTGAGASSGRTAAPGGFSSARASAPSIPAAGRDVDLGSPVLRRNSVDVPVARAGNARRIRGTALRSPVAPPADEEILHRPVPGEPAVGDDVSLGRARTVDLRERQTQGASSAPSVTAIDASPLNGPPSSRQWPEQPDPRQRRARQSAVRRYE